MSKRTDNWSKKQGKPGDHTLLERYSKEFYEEIGQQYRINDDRSDELLLKQWSGRKIYASRSPSYSKRLLEGDIMASGKTKPEMTVQEAGRRGGRATRRKFGQEFYEEIGRMSGEVTKREHGPNFTRRLVVKVARVGVRNVKKRGNLKARIPRALRACSRSRFEQALRLGRLLG